MNTQTHLLWSLVGLSSILAGCLADERHVPGAAAVSAEPRQAVARASPLPAPSEHGACDHRDAPARAPACEPRLYAYAQDCVSEQLAAAAPPSAVEAIATCTGDERFGPAYDDVCLMDPSLAFCTMTAEQLHVYMTAVCAGELALPFPVDLLGLSEQPVPDAVRDALAAVCPGTRCASSARLGAYGAERHASLAAAMAAVSQRLAPEVPASFLPVLHLEAAPAFVADAVAALAAAGPVELGALDTAYPVATGANAYHTIYVVHDPASRRVLAVERLVYD